MPASSPSCSAWTGDAQWIKGRTKKRGWDLKACLDQSDTILGSIFENKRGKIYITEIGHFDHFKSCDTKYTHIVVQPAPSSVSRTSSFSQTESVPKTH